MRILRDGLMEDLDERRIFAKGGWGWWDLRGGANGTDARGRGGW